MQLVACKGRPRLQVDIGEVPAAGANVFDESDDEQAPAVSVEARSQELPKAKTNKLAELANKKRKEMVRLTFQRSQSTQSARHPGHTFGPGLTGRS